jgi:hypothetical protein
MYNLRDLTVLTWLASMGGRWLAWLVWRGGVPGSQPCMASKGITWSSASL